MEDEIFVDFYHESIDANFSQGFLVGLVRAKIL